jgi:hypothetical protein
MAEVSTDPTTAAHGAWNGPAKTSQAKTVQAKTGAGRPLDWRKQMSDTVAYALLVYTALQILVTMHAMTDDGAAMLPLFALVVLVAGIIPLFRHYERHWERLDDAAAADPARRPLFRRDQLSVWLFAIGLPFAITALFKAYASLPG